MQQNSNNHVWSTRYVTHREVSHWFDQWTCQGLTYGLRNYKTSPWLKVLGSYLKGRSQSLLLDNLVGAKRISMASDFGHAAMQFPQLVLNCIRFAITFVIKNGWITKKMQDVSEGNVVFIAVFKTAPNRQATSIRARYDFRLFALWNHTDFSRCLARNPPCPCLPPLLWSDSTASSWPSTLATSSGVQPISDLALI